MKKVKVVAPDEDFQDELLARLKRITPHKTEDGKRPTASFEVARTDEKVLSEVKYAILTGIQAFDDLVGGFPVGRISEMYGTESCGKTAMALRLAVQAQMLNLVEIKRQGNNDVIFEPIDKDKADIAVLYIDNEQSVDDDSTLVIEGTQADVVLSRADTVDLMFKMIDELLKLTAERQRRFPNRLQIPVVIGDTVAATSSRQELEQEWGKEDYTRQAQQISRGFRRLVRAINRNNGCVIFTNQIRENVKEASKTSRRPMPTPQDIEFTTFGGRALRYYASHRIFMFKLNSKYRLVPEAQFAAGFLIGFVTTKNRIRKPLREGRMALIFDKGPMGGLNNVFSLLETLIHLRFCEVMTKEKGINFKFKFLANDVPMTTFNPEDVETSLAEDDDKPTPKRGRGKKEPMIRTRAQWPAFYEAHKADFDVLWQRAVTHAFVIDGLNNPEIAEDAEDDENDYIDVESDADVTE